ncbi:IclR family transcriptional regulator [Phycicoccus flavus]|uniref:IclR family transcriptional regulator n=1 Tax=Phycicoccus flavus TaxID=2502783 RepID=A0A8T6R8A9_9MICO|nr:IclR family transcriptional regulator [Phycicoccus flavus]NHA70227.1 IclR family transcriptional regulator [Phycicoccus flavus]
MSSGVQSVQRAVALLGAVAERPAGLVDLAGATDLPVSTTARLLSTLVGVDALRRDDDGTYRIGPAVSALGGEAEEREQTIEDVAYPHLVGLATLLDEATGLSVRAGDDTVTVLQVDTPRPVQAQNWEGMRWPLHAGGSGLCVMSTWSAEVLEQYLDEHPDAATVRRRLAEGDPDGVWWTVEDYVEGLTSGAVAVRDRDGAAVAAIYAYGPSYRFPDPARVAEVESALVETAGRVARAWGSQLAGPVSSPEEESR